MSLRSCYSPPAHRAAGANPGLWGLRFAAGAQGMRAGAGERGSPLHPSMRTTPETSAWVADPPTTQTENQTPKPRYNPRHCCVCRGSLNDGGGKSRHGQNTVAATSAARSQTLLSKRLRHPGVYLNRRLAAATGGNAVKCARGPYGGFA